MSARGLPEIESSHPYIPEDVLTHARAPHGTAVEYPPAAVVATRKSDLKNEIV
jgi:hypothetical protein